MYILVKNKLKNIKERSSKAVYSTLLERKTSAPISIEKWIDLYPFMEGQEWNGIFQLPYKIAMEPYLQSVQYKILKDTTTPATTIT